MKKIGTYDWIIGIGRAVEEVIPTALTYGVDIYKENDSSVRIFPHKINYDEAIDSAISFLHKNNVEFFDKNIYYEHEGGKTICIINGKRDKVLVGVARFNPSDKKYSHSIGQAIAYSRASGKKLPDDLAYYLNIKQ